MSLFVSKHTPNSQRGFSLLELIIAVLVLGVVVSIALPALTRSRLNANDELAKTTVRTVATAFETYRAAAQPPSYPLTLLDLTAANPPYIDLSLTTASSLTKSGHDCSILATGANTFSFLCSPTTAGTTGEQHVCIKETGELFTSKTGFTAGCVESVGTTTTTTTTTAATTTTTTTTTTTGGADTTPCGGDAQCIACLNSGGWWDSGNSPGCFCSTSQYLDMSEQYGSYSCVSVCDEGYSGSWDCYDFTPSGWPGYPGPASYVTSNCWGTLDGQVCVH